MEVEVFHIPAARVEVRASRMFTYPTRLVDSWKADIQEIIVPAFAITRPAMELSCRQGLTQLFGGGESRLKSVYKSSLKVLLPLKADSYIVDARHDTDGNIAHILANVVCLLKAASNYYPNITVILRSRPTKMAVNAYRTLGIPIICTDRAVSGKIIAPKLSADGAFRGLGLYSEFLNKIPFSDFETDTPERVFISRRTGRRIVNEDEVDAFLQQRGFHKVYFEDIPISRQWSIGRNARVVVGVHGAALSSVVFNQNNVKLVELYHPGYIVKMFRYISNIVGGTWCAVTGEYPPDIIRRLDYEKRGRFYATESTRISLDSLAAAMDYMEVS